MRPIDYRPALAALALAALLSAGPALAQGVPATNARTINDQEIFTSGRHVFRLLTIAEGLDHPWSMAWTPGGDLLLTERAGRLRLIRDGKLLPEPVSGVPPVRARGQGGLFEVVLHPRYVQNRLVYLSYAKPSADGTQATTAVARGRFEDDQLIDVEEIFVADAWSTSIVHFGGRMAFDRDGYLYLSVGDRGEEPNLKERHPAQSLSQHQGKILRLQDDGRVPPDNPFVGREGAKPEIWSYGHRNPQGLALHPTTGAIWETEHGPRGGDELNVIRKGANFGWPVVSHGINYDGTSYTTRTQREDVEAPRWAWVPSIATSGLMFYTGDAFGWWTGDLFVGGLVGEQVARVTLDGDRVVGVEPLMVGRWRVRDVRQGPEGFLYLALDDQSGRQLTQLVRVERALGDVVPPR